MADNGPGVLRTMVFANTVEAMEAIAKILAGAALMDAAARGIDIPNVSHVIRVCFLSEYIVPYLNQLLVVLGCLILWRVALEYFRYHSDSSLEERTKNLLDFQQEGGVFVCTDDATRGIDIPNVSLVIQSGKTIHVLTRIAPVIGSDFSFMNIVSWSPDGDLLAVPGLKNDVVMYDRDTAEKLLSLKGDHVQPICFLSWSPNRKYMATSGLVRQILIWDVDRKQDID
ncbi:hypothetical protein FXO37_10164 [Capsicum annuum]|nr:hypothetical protein FXO37_10164 [Capsicum annuum]